MGLYGRHILPKLVHLTCSKISLMRQREKVVPLARGRVLEVGIGSGLNLPFYDAGKVTRVIGLDPSAEMIRLARKAIARAAFEVELFEIPVEELPLDEGSIDTVLVTFTLCTLPNARSALQHLARLLKPGGELIFCEHGLAPDEGVRRWQNKLNPLWTRLGGGCHLNRDIPELIRTGGFRIQTMQAMYLPGWRPASFNYWGTAGRA